MNSMFSRIGTLAFTAIAFSLLVSPAWSQNSLAEMDKAFQVLQGGIANVEKSRVITTKVDIDAALDDYVEKAYAAFKEVTAAVEKDAKSGKDTGARKQLRSFEERIKPQKASVERMVERLAAINVEVRRGAIRLDPAVLKQATPEDIKDLSEWLTPMQKKYYQKLDPRIVGSAGSPDLALSDPLSVRYATVELMADRCNTTGSLRAAFEKGLNLFVPEAQASLAGGCYAVCAASLGFGCIVCIVGAGGSALTAYNNYVKARNSCGTCRWYKPWNCVCRAAAAVAFLAILA